MSPAAIPGIIYFAPLLASKGNLGANFWQWLSNTWQVALKNSDATQILLALLQTILAFLPLIVPVAITLFRVLRKRKPTTKPVAKSDISPFEKIPPRSEQVLQKLLSNSTPEPVEDDPLADYNIPHQTRVAGRDVRREIIDRMEQVENEKKRWILVLGRSGLGKSREAAQVAKTLNDEDWTIVKLKPMGWEILSRPDTKIMEELGEQKLLFFLDNVNRMIPLESGRVGARSPEDQAKLAETHPLDRILDVLTIFEKVCDSENIRVIATARNEIIPKEEGEPSEFQKLGLNQFSLWKRFQQYSLPDPDIEALVNLQRQGVEAAGLEADPNQFQPLAEKSDRTMRVFINNLKKASQRQLPLEQVSAKNLQDSWRSLYNRAKAQYSATPQIYAAVFLLRALKVSLHPTTVIPTARMLMSRGKIRPWGWLNHWQIQRTFNALATIDNSILNPKDGQLEASGTTIEPGEYVLAVLKILLNLSQRQQSAEILQSLVGFGIATYEMGHYAQALKSLRQFTTLAQTVTNIPQRNSQSVLGLQGNCHYFLGRKEEAIDSYDRAIQIKSDDNQAWYNRGVTLSALGRKEEALDSYDRALQFKHDDHETWYNRGVALSALGHKEEALDSYDRATQIKHDYYQAWNNRGTALYTLGRNEEAIESYDRALQIKHDDHQVWYGKARCYARWGKSSEAIKFLQQPIQLHPLYREIAKTDPDFDGIRENEQFKALVGESF